MSKRRERPNDDDPPGVDIVLIKMRDRRVHHTRGAGNDRGEREQLHFERLSMARKCLITARAHLGLWTLRNH